ncbi:MAG TPA: LysM peptidoglycan-binding domain-containing protein [Firmicutes bacterium]|uniref:LysM peptidoglycan-binding domain-containing protein n=1 Tax=Capillibacterium thermochitinicola TaxID=2699427 RepID=A0A8J6I1C9_9FIRM|nr:LysM peptidoglycan-binding domain-containing protein [Capillibacterium thermochitinicola]MBA2133646.1 LysM peptidoglycan-binding domain-containing protein [Capillibacterium thermochitinicola]HHW12124.1 LysM peptidoglycan-binding domain-containing protein [Bacillota bacterium]
MNTTETRTGEVRLGTVRYVRLRRRWRWNPRKGLANLVFFIFMLCFILMAFYYSATKSQGQALGREITVEMGDTLWEIASRHYPNTDPRKPIAEIMKLNNMKTSMIYTGQVLRLPQ